LATSVDREHTFEVLVGFFEAAGGVTRLARTAWPCPPPSSGWC
jgi:hypothetical protein